ncbi:MAG: hypothetical protein LC785_03465 [Acidobacteria bacterium]|nr:hypothetical protein [Acidobacteriota bacterium]MCA1641042.1 hypothetical protein [Acidobacteriota bacterium]
MKKIGSAGLLLSLALSLAALAPTSAARQRAASVDERTLAQAEAYTGDRFDYFTETPRGAHVAALRRPRAEMLRAIDDGLAELFRVARRNGYGARLNHSDYTVFIGRADRTRNRDGQYSPDVAIGAAQYRGSVYDQGGYVYAAGIVSSFSPCAFVIAEHESDWARVSNVVRYEGEHLVLYHNDRRRYQQTYDHSRGGSHPILQ